MEFYFDTNNETQMKFFFLTEDELQINKEYGKNRNLKEWWDGVFRQRLYSIYQGRVNVTGKTSKQNNVEELLKKISGQCMATIACCKSKTPEMLPTFLGNSHSQILTMLLNKEQVDAINGSEKHKIIYGPYGSGKSIVAEQIVRKICQNSMGKKCLIVYAIQDDYTMLEFKNRQFIDILKSERIEKIQNEAGIVF